MWLNEDRWFARAQELEVSVRVSCREVIIMSSALLLKYPPSCVTPVCLYGQDKPRVGITWIDARSMIGQPGLMLAPPSLVLALRSSSSGTRIISTIGQPGLMLAPPSLVLVLRSSSSGTRIISNFGQAPDLQPRDLSKFGMNLLSRMPQVLCSSFY